MTCVKQCTTNTPCGGKRRLKNKKKMLLSSILSDYKKNDLLALRTFLGQLSSMGDFVFGRNNPLGNYASPSNHLSKDSHQYRLRNSVLIRFVNLLTSAGSTLNTFSTFDDIHKHVNKIADTINGIGPVAVYDASLRYGFSKNIMPDFVYLHAGTLKGAKNYFKRKKITRVIDHNGNFLSANKLKSGSIILPRNFSEFPLSGMDIEHLLCIYKDRI